MCILFESEYLKLLDEKSIKGWINIYLKQKSKTSGVTDTFVLTYKTEKTYRKCHWHIEKPFTQKTNILFINLKINFFPKTPLIIFIWRGKILHFCHWNWLIYENKFRKHFYTHFYIHFFLLSEHILRKESIVIVKNFDFEILTYLYILRSLEFIYAIFEVMYVCMCVCVCVCVYVCVYVSEHDSV